MIIVDNKRPGPDDWATAGEETAPSRLTHADWAFQQLRDAILAGVLLPGAKISEPASLRMSVARSSAIACCLRATRACQVVVAMPASRLMISKAMNAATVRLQGRPVSCNGDCGPSRSRAS